MVILAAIQERKLRIETGYGAETKLTDGQVLEISRSLITPRFKEGDYNGGLYNGTLAIAKRLDPSLTNVAPAPAKCDHSARAARRFRFAVRSSRFAFFAAIRAARALLW